MQPLFEQAVDAVVDGDAIALATLLRDHPELVHARSMRITEGNPPVHGATLLHYIAANGVEDERQRSPNNAVEIATLLLDAGADPNAVIHAYGSQCSIMSMLVSSTPPARAGVQVPLMDLLIDRGASELPLMSALVFGFKDAAQALVDRGAPIDTFPVAAGLGRIDEVKRMLPVASADDRHRALALSAQLGHPDIVAVLLDAGEDPNRYNPPGTHAHSMPLHQAIAAGHLDVVKTLVERGASLDVKDTIHDGTPLAWAKHCEQPEIEKYLVKELANRT